MKNLIYLSLIIATGLLSSCGKDFLDTQNLTEQNTSSFYSTPDDIQEALGGVYNSMFIPKLLNEPTLIANILSDDMLAGGGSDDVLAKNMEFWTKPEEDSYLSVWETYYAGIFRANMIITKFDQATYTDEDKKNQDLGEAHIMRAFFYFKLAKMFGGIPVITDPIGDPNQSRATLDDTYALISSDLKKAIEIMPKTPVTAIPENRNGHANVWVAEALMARVYLFYTGYSTNTLGIPKTELPLVDGGSISKTDVSTWISDMITNSGHQLNTDPRSNWPYSYLATAGVDYPYAVDEKLTWAQDGRNIETVFAIKFGAFANWGGAEYWTNRVCLANSIRGNSMVPFGEGWGMATVNPQLWGTYSPNDIRRNGSIIDISDSKEKCDSYEGGKGDHETGYWNKKYTNIQYDDGDGVAGMFYNLYGGQKHFMLWHQQDLILIRYSDVLLMAAELGIDAQTNLDAVRTRSKLASIAPTIENIRKERRLELCFEGIRFYDMLRYGTAQQDIEAVNVAVNSYGVSEQFVGKYNPATNGLLPIPESQIRLSNGVLTQNPGW